MSAPIPIFWCEPTAKVLLSVSVKGESVARRFGPMPEAEAKVKSLALWYSLPVEFSSTQPIYRAPDGREFLCSEAPAGAMWDAEWLRPFGRTGSDGIDLIVVCPDGWHWHVDSRASNCTKKEDATHRCWCRHGDPRRGRLHVDKLGDTCAAGAGSIQTPKWHGFLHHSQLTTC